MKYFKKKRVAIFAKSSILDIYLNSEYASVFLPYASLLIK